jgi:plastocyanin
MRRSTSLTLSLVALVPLLALASCSSGGGGTSTAPPPATKELDSPTIAATSGTFAHRFFTAGTFPYHCAIHTVMVGANVIVSNSAPAGDSLATITIVGTTSPFYSPNTVTIHTGGKVTWNNTNAMPHTVTSD